MLERLTAGYLLDRPSLRELRVIAKEVSAGRQVVRAIPPMMPSESPLLEPKPNSIRLSCSECNGVVLPLPGHGAAQTLEGRLERDHWHPWQAARDAASETLNKSVQEVLWTDSSPVELQSVW